MEIKVLISPQKLVELENMAKHYKTMEEAVKIAQERSQKLTVRNMELVRDIDRASFELKDLRNRIESISNTKAKSLR